MSNELSKECDSLLASTSILDHHYGIPDITKNHIKLTSSNKSMELEKEYYRLHGELSQKLNKLTYLNKLDELNGQSVDKIEEQYHEILNNKLDKIPILEYAKDDEISKLKAIRQYYELQVDNFKTRLLLNNYLQITLPILRSIHKLDTGITTTEMNISQNLSSLYSINEHDKNANVNKLIKSYQELNKNNKTLDKLAYSISNTLNNELQSKLKDLNNLSVNLKEKHTILLKLKRDQIKEFLDENDNGVYEKFHTLVNEWSYISIICELLSSFIISLPIDWYQDRSLRRILFEIENISLKISKYQLIINVNSLKNFELEELYMIDLDELEIESDTSSND
ncbi:uncharacterized protein AC631_01812 [Debaryomyces fabryi]|uniref:Uncharacterized protein n=1 Tax=Debaryomyces fabryi TaxID=58627 RepID=A0A0V1Q1Q3_9ASCO|nr:uncharacterized protein AC631_01812 [Debaryomyces fabryi]KSA02443.1 hypothetical protein AC631_01812 [Debaryomyces fabryi]CUM54817.1 unnamed protein product [Debaryomyces fabryi]